MSDVRSDAEYVEAELIEEEPGDDRSGNDAAADTEWVDDATDSASLDTQAIDVVEIIESDPEARVLEEHVAEQEWTREFVIEDDLPAPEQSAQQPEAEPATAHDDARAAADHAEVSRDAAPAAAPEPRIQSLPMVKALNAG